VILVKLIENVHGNEAIIFEEIKCHATNCDFQDDFDPVALLGSVLENIDENKDIIPMSGEDVGKGFTANLVKKASSFLLGKVNFRIKDACKQ
jgi:hypothetical protein